jgi:voltage-gated potassium channel
MKKFLLQEYEDLRTTYVLFRKERVFTFLLLILVLMVISGLLFMALEYDRVLAAMPDKGGQTTAAKLVTVMYWAIVTITTVGYGDISPATTAGRLMTIVVLYLSVATVTLFSANLASALTTKKIMERLKGRGVAVLQKQKGLFVICGWKSQMNDLVSKILSVNKALKPDDIVIIADITEEEIQKFKTDPALERVNFIQGQYHAKTTLLSVNLKDARKVMVFADVHGNDTEADAKTVMTVITIKAIAPTVYVCAEVLNSDYESHLRSALCDEMIHIREYSRTLLANASSSVGIAHIIQDLLDIASGVSLVTEHIPEAFHYKTYAEYQTFVGAHSSDTMIGILENTGTLYEMKHYAIREAQKVADMRTLVQNLNALKKLEGNKPHLNPAPDFVIPRNAMAIFIRRTRGSGAAAGA